MKTPEELEIEFKSEIDNGLTLAELGTWASMEKCKIIATFEPLEDGDVRILLTVKRDKN